MNVCIISGSHRSPSQSLKVARYIQSVLAGSKSGDQSEIISLADNPLPLWDQGVWEGDPKWVELMGPIKKQLQASDALVVVAPEWHGQVPAGLKNFFLLTGKQEVGHKPALIVGVSSGDGGAYPVAELRMSSYKNNRICYIPEQIIVRNVESVLNDDDSHNNQDADRYFRTRIDWTLGILREYAAALRRVRESGALETDVFNNGM